VRALFLLPSPSQSGAERVAFRLLGRARERGLHLVVAAPAGSVAEQARASGAEVVEIPSLMRAEGKTASAALRTASRDLVALARLAPVVRRARIEVLVVNGALGLPVAAALRQLSGHLQVAWLVHDVFHRPSWLRLARAARPFVDRAVAVSEAASRPLARLGYSVQVAPNGTRWPVEPAEWPPPEPPIVGCAALLTPWKGQDLLIEALQRCRGLDDVRVELLGGSFPKDRPFVERLQRLVGDPSLSGRVRLLGHVDDPMAVMRRWTCAVVASRDPEAAPLAVLESMSLGLPVLVPDAGGCPELVGPSGSRYVPGDALALGQALERLVGDAGARARLRAEGRERVERRFVAEACLDRQIDLLVGQGAHEA
jgi:glycosyltransferase involved in cell wall biosynthesis